MPLPKNENRTDAQRKAENKYKAKTKMTVGVSLPRDIAEQFKAYASERKTTVNALLNSYIMECLNSDEK
ncbi:MAG: hypothetical protein IIW86_05360 [Clostridia bacterium]|nr:hypothetical protein [Clostridia bacterium]